MIKRMMYSAVLSIVSLLLVIGAGLAQDEGPVFRIGVLDDERGEISSGARLAVREINANGGVEGADGTVFRLELIFQPTEAGDSLAEAIDALDDADVIAVLGPKTTDAVLSNLPILQSLNVPILTPAIGDTVIASDNSGLLFRTRAAERLQGATLAEYLINSLNVQRILSVQLDRTSTAPRVGFSVALSQIAPDVQEDFILLDNPDDLIEMTSEVIGSNPQVIVAFGPSDLAADFYTQLRGGDWIGIFAYDEAEDVAFRANIPLEALQGILGTTTWPVSAADAAGTRFLNAYVRTFGDIPGPVATASYDAVYLLAEAIGRPGDLTTNLSTVRNVPGVQGMLNPDDLPLREMSDSTTVIQLNALGGFDVAARYAGTDRLPEDVAVVEGEPTVEPTPTPDGVEITIRSVRQNVRTGPGLEYDVLGQMQEGERARVIGATVDFSWVVIDFRGQQGFLATYLLDVFGDRSSVPVVSPPPTPTPGPATATPTQLPFPDLVITAASPTTITRGVTTNINVTVSNQGAVDAGPFAVAATFLPDDYFSALNLPGLAAGTQTVIQLPVLLETSTGNFEVVIIPDLNNEVNQGPYAGNRFDFQFRYKVDRQLILINNTTLGVGSTLDLEGAFTPNPDIRYDSGGLTTVDPCTGSAYCIGLLSPSLNWDTSHYDAISAANGVNTTFIPNSALTPGATIGVLTADGRRGVIRVDSINPGVSITITFRLYQ